MEPSVLEEIVNNAMKMASSATNKNNTAYAFEVVGPVAAALVTGALTNQEIKAALLEWRPTQKL